MWSVGRPILRTEEYVGHACSSRKGGLPPVDPLLPLLVGHRRCLSFERALQGNCQRQASKLLDKHPHGLCRLVLDRPAMGERIPHPLEAVKGQLPLCFQAGAPRGQRRQGKSGDSVLYAPPDVVMGREDTSKVGQGVEAFPEVARIPARLVRRNPPVELPEVVPVRLVGNPLIVQQTLVDNAVQLLDHQVPDPPGLLKLVSVLLPRRDARTL